VTDKSVGCFLKGGKMIELMAAIGGFELVLRAPLLDREENTRKSRKIRLVHLGNRKIFKGFG
jgi:hypothetical protein